MSPPHPIPLPAGERGGGGGNLSKSLTKFSREHFYFYRDEPQYLFNVFLRRDTSRSDPGMNSPQNLSPPSYTFWDFPIPHQRPQRKHHHKWPNSFPGPFSPSLFCEKGLNHPVFHKAILQVGTPCGPFPSFCRL